MRVRCCAWSRRAPCELVGALVRLDVAWGRPPRVPTGVVLAPPPSPTLDRRVLRPALSWPRRRPRPSTDVVLASLGLAWPLLASLGLSWPLLAPLCIPGHPLASLSLSWLRLRLLASLSLSWLRLRLLASLGLSSPLTGIPTLSWVPNIHPRPLGRERRAEDNRFVFCRKLRHRGRTVRGGGSRF